MRINIGEVTFNTDFAPKNFDSGHFIKIKGVDITTAKRKNFFLIRGIIPFQGPFC